MVLTTTKILYCRPGLKPPPNSFPFAPLLHVNPKRISYFFFELFCPVNESYSSKNLADLLRSPLLIVHVYIIESPPYFSLLYFHIYILNAHV